MCNTQFAAVASKENPNQTSRYPITNAPVGANNRPANSRFSLTRPNIMTVGVTEGSIIANIMIAHMTNMNKTSAVDHCMTVGIVIWPIKDDW